jgi:hypothetical protein
MTKFPYPVVECRGAEALAEWARLWSRGQTEGFYPVIVGDAHDMENLAGSITVNASAPASIIERASGLSGAGILDARVKQDPELYGDVEEGDWPDDVAHQSIVSHTDLSTGKPKAKVYIAQIPTVYSYEVPAYLRYGGWNDCPCAEEQVAIHRMWSEQYGARIIAATGDVIECTVTKPPTSRDSAIKLAREQFIYCTDIVFQGVESLGVLAAGLKDHDAWFFWWD